MTRHASCNYGGCMLHRQSGAFRDCPGFDVATQDHLCCRPNGAADCASDTAWIQPGLFGGAVTPPILFHKPFPVPEHDYLPILKAMNVCANRVFGSGMPLFP
jgi:hypothetical protein